MELKKPPYNFSLLDDENLNFQEKSFYKEMAIICANPEIADTVSTALLKKKIYKSVSVVNSINGAYGIFILPNDQMILIKDTENLLKLSL